MHNPTLCDPMHFYIQNKSKLSSEYISLKLALLDERLHAQKHESEGKALSIMS